MKKKTTKKYMTRIRPVEIKDTVTGRPMRGGNVLNKGELSAFEMEEFMMEAVEDE